MCSSMQTSNQNSNQPTGHEECSRQTRRAVVNRLERSITIDVSVTWRRRAAMRGQAYARADLDSSILLLGERTRVGINRHTRKTMR